MEVASIDVDREEARKRVEEFTANRRKKLTEMDKGALPRIQGARRGADSGRRERRHQEGRAFPRHVLPEAGNR